MSRVRQRRLSRRRPCEVVDWKVFPEWQRRFVVYEKRLDLPRLGIAARVTEAYLPFSGKDRR